MRRILFIAALAAILIGPAFAERKDGFRIAEGDALPAQVVALPGKGSASLVRKDAGTRANVVLFIAPESEKSEAALKAMNDHVAAKSDVQHVSILAVQLGGTEEQAQALSEKLGLRFPVAIDRESKVFGAIAESGVPRVVIANGKGTVEYLHAGYVPGREGEWISAVASLAKEAPVKSSRKTARNARELSAAVDLRGKDAPKVDIETWITPGPADTKGMFVMYDLWATWCGPCISALNTAESMHDQFSDRLVTIAISDEDVETVQKFVAKRRWKQPIAVDTQGRLKKALGVRGIPHAYLVSPQGKVLWQGHPMELWGNNGQGLKALLGGL